MFAQADWLALLQTFGLATFLLLVTGLALWRTANWTAREIILPARDKLLVRVVSFLDHIETTVTKLDINVDAVTSNLREQTASLKDIKDINTRTQTSTEKVAGALEDQHQSLHAIIQSAISEGKARHDLVMARLTAIDEMQTRILGELLAREREGT